ncbi:alpha/beta-hydrolase [Corynespora cassiicola Philippines]|uniref:Alpha/beta-hydrolase n=1 Tax=Corynespora cassiicola Philippines TaxID=1448308 RepID=A0A2T2NA77_CORCC|nr:alpha/beta-hydrolase [Corynespora cassiicola Philippines]
MATPYNISVPDAEIQRLRSKLELTSFPDELDDAGWAYGAPLAEVKRLVAYWKDSYDWRKAEATLNKLPNYTIAIEVDGFGPIDIHFLHQKSNVESAIPLIFVHGWPGSFFEATKILPLLADSEKNGEIAFDVVVPSLPNFGFSGAVKKKGFGAKQYAEVCHKLMLALGYEQYVSQGGDWGSFFTRLMSLLYPDHLKATHINMVTCYPPMSLWKPMATLEFVLRYAFKWFSPGEKAGLERTKWYQDEGQGYYHIQKSKPQTLGYGLADSPVGLLAWIHEKLHDWTDDYSWTDDEILTWISIYWFSTAGPAANLRVYYESLDRGEYPAVASAVKYNPKTPLGLSYFPKELCLLPRSWANTLGPIVYRAEHKQGGHFAAYECPETIVGDLRIMFGKGGGGYGAVEGKTGYA